MSFTVDPQRLEEVLGTLVPAYEKSLPPYDRPSMMLPQDPRHMPPGIEDDPLMLARFFFYSCLFMRGLIKSVDAIKRLSRLFSDEQTAGRVNLLEPRLAIIAGPTYIAPVLQRYRLSFLYNSRGWSINSQRLLKKYDGDPRRILDGVTDYETACQRICNDDHGGGMYGYREKMVSMLLYYLMDFGLITKFPYPPPVDFHHVRIAISNGIIKIQGAEGLTSRLLNDMLKSLRKAYFDYSSRKNIPPDIIANTVWLYSAYMCRYAPGTTMSAGEYQARSTELTIPKINWGSPAIMQSWDRTCGSCLVEPTCKLSVPSAEYYRHGTVGQFVQPRQSPPAPRLPTDLPPIVEKIRVDPPSESSDTVVTTIDAGYQQEPLPMDY